ncbi:MAG TPA: hypothetical protein VGZ52_02310, partial [Acidimicrobiales bacterium]|nr:hypothetical protein [Acidimicrobiales bacterium]
IPAVSRTIPFSGEQQYLMREVKPGPNTVMLIAYVTVGIVALAWAAAFVLACTQIPKSPPLVRPAGRRRPSSGPRSPSRPAPEPAPELVSR